MNEPRYPEDVFKIIWLWLGIVFTAMGLLFVCVIRPGIHSTGQEPDVNDVILLVFGAIFLIAYFVLRGIAARKKKLHNELLASGTKVDGTVEKVCQQNTVRYGGKYPYIIFYTYQYQGKVYHGESSLFWDRPAVMEQDSIVVYANDSGDSTIQLGA